jgi:hypothetical protein
MVQLCWTRKQMRIFTITHEYSMEMITYVAVENKEIQHLEMMEDITL